jgi:AcrR family transcriptional regulator
MRDSVIESLKKKDSGTTGKGMDRARDILDAARALFAAEGYAGLSMRGVATALGVSLSTVQHYYRDKDTLVEAVLLYQMDLYQAAVAGLTAALADAGPEAHLRAALNLFLTEAQRPDVGGVFMEIWSLANRHPAAARVLDQVRRRERLQFQQLVQGVAPALDEAELGRRARLMIALIEGLTVQLSRGDGAADETAALVKAAETALLGVARG